jgi:hypothetical protein
MAILALIINVLYPVFLFLMNFHVLATKKSQCDKYIGFGHSCHNMRKIILEISSFKRYVVACSKNIAQFSKKFYFPL